MTIIINIGVVLVSMFIGIFLFSQSVLPIIYSWPLATQLKRNGMLIRNIPTAAFVIPPMIYWAITFGAVWAMFTYTNYGIACCFGLLWGLIKIIRNMNTPQGKLDMVSDFQSCWGDRIAQ